MKRMLALACGLALVAIGLPQVRPPFWLDRFNGNTNGYDDAGAACADASGNVYVAGMSPTSNGSSSYFVVKYTPLGTRAWVGRHSQAGGMALTVAVDSEQNVYTAGYRWAQPYYEEVLVKFDATGQELWSRRLNGRPTKLLPDKFGNVYVIGQFSDGYDSDWSTMKIGPNGAVLWEVRYDSPSGRNDELANGMFDATGNLVVAGTVGTDQNAMPGDVSVAKYHPMGFVLWQRFYSHGPTTHDFVDDFGIDMTGAVTIMGGTAASASVYETASELWLKFGAGGDILLARVGAQTPNGNVGTGVVDRGGNLYHVTFSQVTKFSPTGTVLWRRQLDSPQLGVTIPLIRLAPSGGVIVAGTSFDGTFKGDYLVHRFLADGSQTWIYRYDGPEHGDDTVADLCITPNGRAYVTGTSWNQYTSIGGTADDIVTLGFSLGIDVAH